MSGRGSARFTHVSLHPRVAGIMLVAMSGDGKSGAGRRPRAISRPRVPPGPLADLKALLYELYLQAGTPTLDQVAALIAADEHEELAGAPGRDTINRIIGSPLMPPSQADVVAVATVLARAARWDPADAARRARNLWVAAQMAAAAVVYPHHAPAVGLEGLAGEVRVAEADLRRLGVRAAIAVPGVPDEVPPEYVARDADDQVRAKVAAAAARGGFVLLVGDSSVGKTRCAAEAVKAVLPGWRLVHPAGPSEAAALAAEPVPQMVVWLDELQRYLGGEQGLTGGVVRALLNPPHPAVIIGTLWPHWYNPWTAMPGPDSADPHAREREVLDLADVIRIAPELGTAEQDRARAAAARDRRLAVALGTAGYGLTQTLAAAPQLVARWENAGPYARAVLTAALDAARLGARAPLSADFLRAAAPGYCTSQQQAEAPENWFEQALSYSTGKLHGAAAALSPVGSGMGQITGYIAADYLIHHVGRERRYARVPASTWDAIVSYHLRDPADTARLADSARNRLLYCYAIPLYRHAADAGDRAAAGRLAELLAERGDLDQLRAQADAGDVEAVYRLAELLERRGDLVGAEQILRAQAGAGDEWVTWRLADLLARHGDLDQLRARADAGDDAAAQRLAELLAEQEDLDGLHTLVKAGNKWAAGPLAELLAKRRDLDGLRAMVEGGNRTATVQLTRLLAERGDLDGAEQILRARADAGDSTATQLLARVLAGSGDLKGAVHLLRTRAGADDAALQLAELLADVLAAQGDLEGLRARADAGDGTAARRLAKLLAERKDLDGLRARADAGDEEAAYQLANLLAVQGDLDGLRAQVGVGNLQAVIQMADLLAERRDLDGLRARADAGDWLAAGQLARLLVERGDLDELRARVDAGDGIAARRLADLFAKLGLGEEAKRLRRFGLNPDGSIASGPRGAK